jgi:translocator protein
MNWTALVTSVIVCVALAAAGNAWVGEGLKTWYPSLVKPRWQVPLWGFMLVGIAVYVVEGIILYRLQVHVPRVADRVVTIAALSAVMICNEAWNYVFFGLRRLDMALAAMIGFLMPLAVLMIALLAREPTSAALLAPYCVWVAYDVWWIRELARLNPAVDENSPKF